MFLGKKVRVKSNESIILTFDTFPRVQNQVKRNMNRLKLRIRPFSVFLPRVIGNTYYAKACIQV